MSNKKKAKRKDKLQALLDWITAIARSNVKSKVTTVVRKVEKFLITRNNNELIRTSYKYLRSQEKSHKIRQFLCETTV